MMQDVFVLVFVMAAVAVGAYWYLQFMKVLPLEKELRAARRQAARHKAFAQEMLRAHRVPATPQAFVDSVQYAADRFHAHCGGYHLFIWMRRSTVGAFSATAGELVCRTGMLENLEAGELTLAEDLWERVFQSAAGVDGDAGLPRALARAFGPANMRAARTLPWGTMEKLWGVLVMLPDPDTAQDRAGRSDVPDLLAAYIGSLADRAVHLWELNQAREQLEGGLSVTMARLDETNLKLIRRAKEMNTLEEITDAISEHLDQAEILKSIVSIVARTLESDLCAFLLYDETTGELVTQPGAYGVLGDEGSLYRISLDNDDASSVRVFKTGKHFMTGDAQNDPQVIAHFARLWKCHSLMVVPLVMEGKRKGVMRVGCYERDRFTPDDLKLVRVIAEEAAVLVESVMLAEKLADTNRELAELHRMKDDFVSTVSHEFKTPLTSIKGFVTVLLDQEVGPLNEEQKRFLKIINSASERLSSLVNDMLDMSRLERGLEIEMSGVDLEKAARLAVENHRYIADNKGVRLVLETPPLLPRALGNDEWLKHVFNNLLSNALKFTPDRGEVTITLASKGDCLETTVSDTGIGIPEADQEHVFEKFYRAANRQAIKAPGTGLGLAICKSVIDKHGGRIWLESVPGQGTRFHFVLPAAEKDIVVTVPSSKEEAG
ncbi:MAG: GAF domain-containing sensor histidine kinase [Elusimicrobiota bacterium]